MSHTLSQATKGTTETMSVTAATTTAAANKSHDKALLESGLFSDVVVKCGEESWRLHRTILSRCVWFHKALTGSFEEATSGVVIIHAFEPKHISWLLEYIYLGGKSNLSSLFLAGGILMDRLDLDLQDLCGQTLMATRLMDVFDLGDFFAIPKLREEAMGYFSKYLAEELSQIQREYRLYDSEKLAAHIRTIRAVYGRDTPAQEHFLPVLTEFIHRARYRLLREPEFTALLDEIPALAVKMFRTMIDSGEFVRVSYPSDCTKCGDDLQDTCTHEILPKTKLRAYCKKCAEKKAFTPPTTDWMGRFAAYQEKKEEYKKSLETQSDQITEIPNED
ncbi:hypothetical protein DL765_003824 [Monosporascus sp. GIB2]|nr:hypothetical protein DL765_003824 [Monosporascus sp. GIB2]